MKNIFTNSMILMLVFCCFSDESFAQDKAEKTSEVKQMIDAKKFEFIAQSMTPTSGRMRQLTSYYSLIVKPDTLNSDLPYAGRAYSAPMDPAATGVSFISTSYDYKITDRKKGGWDIEIRPKDVNTVQTMQLTVYDNGSAYLRVQSNQRQPISYNGTVGAVKEKKQ
ncbi:DUF4251 domain-containing protein [Pollutibacter soli]|uniref:DUF4251 domain-containing protein n=1 Tax=Pollutibacter soli TaxID=3034157 RepID=UPI003013814B